MRRAGAAPNSGIIPGKSLPRGHGHKHLDMGAGQIFLELPLWGLKLPAPLTPQKQGLWVPGKIWETKGRVVLEQNPWAGRLKGDAGQAAKLFRG